jgi:hypothetical protein
MVENVAKLQQKASFSVATIGKPQCGVRSTRRKKTAHMKFEPSLPSWMARQLNGSLPE